MSYHEELAKRAAQYSLSLALPNLLTSTMTVSKLELVSIASPTYLEEHVKRTLSENFSDELINRQTIEKEVQPHTGDEVCKVQAYVFTKEELSELVEGIVLESLRRNK